MSEMHILSTGYSHVCNRSLSSIVKQTIDIVTNSQGIINEKI